MTDAACRRKTGQMALQEDKRKWSIPAAAALSFVLSAATPVWADRVQPGAQDRGITMTEGREAYQAAVKAAKERFGREPFVFPEFGERGAVIEKEAEDRFHIRFIASSPLDFAHRVEATVARQAGGWVVEQLDISKRLDPFSQP